MKSGSFHTKSLGRSKGYFWTGVACISFAALFFVLLDIMVILDPTIETIALVMGLLVLGVGGFIWLGIFCMEHSKSGYIAQIGEGVDFSEEVPIGTVSVTELKGVGFITGVVERDLRFSSSGIWSRDPGQARVSRMDLTETYRSYKAKDYTIPYADILTITVYKALGFTPRIEICTNFGSKNRFSILGHGGGPKGANEALLKCCSIVNSACPDKLETKCKF